MISWLKRFWKKHIIDDFPYPDDCFDCDEADCSLCKIMLRLTKKGGYYEKSCDEG
jgi:hypothetical protein